VVLIPRASSPVELFINVPDEELDDFPWAPCVHALCGDRFTALEDDLLLFGEPGQSSLLVHLRGNVPEIDPLRALKLLNPITVGEPVEQFFVETAPPDEEEDEDRWSKQLLWLEDIKELRFEKGYGRTDCEVIELLLPDIFRSVCARPNPSEFHKTHALLRAFDSVQDRARKLYDEIKDAEQTALLNRTRAMIFVDPSSLLDVAHLLPAMCVAIDTLIAEVAAARAAGLSRP